MKRLTIFILGLSIALIAVIPTSCTQNTMSKNFGGSLEITLKENEELLNANWKDESLWITTRNTKTGEVIYKEVSPLGIIEGEVKFKKP